MKQDDLKARLRERAEELPAEIAERENEAESHCGSYGTSTAEDYLDDPDRLLLTEAATAITDLEAQVQSLTAELSEERAMWAIVDVERQALVGELGEALGMILDLEIVPINSPQSAARNGKELVRAHAIARATLAKLEKARG